ncbi:hypothetical protein [Halegenticoccus tardaugens]|uniref:hypothetical protein n=1 Tax=Halegenticoccus tardaugens TaxID=2071624 RepID=UPI00100B60E1|nr:hypothetical protein [Halegenticoccus tardaugens]
MAQMVYFVSTVLMGAILIAVAIGLSRGANWRRDRSTERWGASESITRTVRSQTLWISSFLLLVFVLAGSVVVFVNPEAPAQIRGAMVFVLAGAGLSALGAYLAYGIYASARYRGWKSAQAAAASAWILGLLFVLAVVVKLTLGS